MQVHTTQSLITLAQYQSTACVSSKEYRFNQDKFKLRSSQAYSDASSLSFGKKKPSPKDLKNLGKKIVKKNEKSKVGDIKEKAAPETKKGDKFLNGKFFDKMLTLAENEPVIQAAMSALICIGLRPITIMALPTKKGKDDNMYAASHSICSGVMGLVSALIIAQPFKMGSSYMMKNMYKDLDIKALERLNPHLDLKSIVDANGNRKPIEEWLDKSGNKFCKEFKDVEKIPMLKMFNDISAESFKQFGADVDWVAQKGKSFNEVVTRDGKSLYDAIDWNRVGIIVEQDGIGEAKLLIKDLNKDYLKEIIADAEEGSAWKKLNLESVYKDGKVQDFRLWKDTEGKQWKLDLDNSYISSEYDTADYIPRISGKTRTESNGEIKHSTYFKNGKDGYLGTEITQDLVDADKRNEVHDKILTWLPDIATRPLVATATIALIPVILKNVFHMEKSKKPEEVKQSEVVNTNAERAKDVNKEQVSFKGRNNENNLNISFKAKPSVDSKKQLSLFERLISKPLAKIYGKPLYESETTSNISEKLSKIPGKMTTHMATIGSLLTSSVYIQQTLNKKDLDSDRRKTLAINQGLCFIIPTICAYTVDKFLTNWIKKNEYRYSGLQENKIALAKRDGKKEVAEIIQKDLGTKLRGVRILASLATFTLIYRYVTPVIITPIANSIGNRISQKDKVKEPKSVNNVDFKAAVENSDQELSEDKPADKRA